MNRRLLLPHAILFLLLMTSTAFGQSAAAPENGRVILTVTAESGQPLKLTSTDFAKLPRHTVHAKDHDGKDVTFEGVEVAEVLKLANVQFGEQMRGKAMALYLVAGAIDDYHAVFALSEFDHGFTDRIIIIADRRNGQPLSEKEGPLRIVAPDEKREARWVRQLNSLTIRRAS
jgi:hypothetical protein